jgi:hypothetical protein
MSDFISDEDMKKMESSSTKSSGSNDFISDEDMNKLETAQPEESKSSFKLDPAVKTAIAGGTGVLTGKTIQKGADLVDDYLIPAIGNLDKKQIDFISQNPETYRNADTLENLMNQWKGLAQDVSNTSQGASNHFTNNLRKITDDVNQASYDKARLAKDSLEGAAPMAKDDYYKAVGSGIANTQGALSDISPEAKKAFFDEHYEVPSQREVSKITADADLTGPKSRLDYFRAQAPEMENFKGSQVYNKFMSDMAKAEDDYNKAIINTKQKYAQEAIGKYKASTGIPKELLESNPELSDKILNPKFGKVANSAVDMAKNPLVTLDAPFVGGDTGLVPLLRESANFDGVNVGPVDKFATNVSESVRNKAGELYPEYDENMKASSRAINSKEALNKAGVKIDDNGVESLSKSSSDKVKKILANPELYPDEFKQLQSAIESSKEFSKNQPLDLAQERYAQANNLENKLKDLKINLDKNSDVDVSSAVQKRLGTYADDLNSPEAKKAINVIDEAKTISSNPNLKSGTDFLNEVKSGNIKDLVKNSSNLSEQTKYKLLQTAGKAGVGGLIGGQVGGGQGAAIGAGAGAVADIYGSKLQELYALQKAGKLGNFVKGANSMLPGILGAGGAALAATAAANAGEISPTEASAVAGVETFNPIPATDAVQAYVDAKKEYKRTGDPASALADGIKGFVSPVANLTQMANESTKDLGHTIMNAPDKVIPATYKAVDDFGTKQSNDARARMEQNYGGNNKVVTASKALNQATPEQLMELSQSFKEIKGADNFVAPLENAAQASSDQERQARLFGLYQQPAFRQLLKKGSKSE